MNSISDFLADAQLPPGATSGGSHAEPTVPPEQATASHADQTAAGAIPYPGYRDPFEGMITKIARRVPALRSVIFDPELENPSRPDSRVHLPLSEMALHPCSAVCRILTRYSMDDKWWLGSGFLIGPGLVATAAHVLQQQATGSAVEIKVMPGWYSGSPYEYPAGPRDWRVCANWPATWESDWDYGVVFLNDPNTTARHGQVDVLSLPVDYWNGLVANRTQFIVSGYPFDKEGSGTQWRGNGRIVNQQGHVVRHICDTEKGDSGAPVLGRFGGKVRAIGVHSKGFENRYNVARKLNADFLADVARWTGAGLTA